MFVMKVALGTFIGIILALYIFPNLPHTWDLTSGAITIDPQAKAEYERRELARNREDNASFLRQQREQIVQNR